MQAPERLLTDDRLYWPDFLLESATKSDTASLRTLWGQPTPVDTSPKLCPVIKYQSHLVRESLWPGHQENSTSSVHACVASLLKPDSGSGYHALGYVPCGTLSMILFGIGIVLTPAGDHPTSERV